MAACTTSSTSAARTIHWDHVVSKDLIHWTRLPPPVRPNSTDPNQWVRPLQFLGTMAASRQSLAPRSSTMSSSAKSACQTPSSRSACPPGCKSIPNNASVPACAGGPNGQWTPLDMGIARPTNLSIPPRLGEGQDQPHQLHSLGALCCRGYYCLFQHKCDTQY